jgi:hypothetical protein
VLITSHVLAGAIIGAAARRHPVVAFATGAVSHLAMDACPHWAPPPDEEGGHEQFVRVAHRDGYAGLAAIALCAGLAPRPARLATLAGMAGAALIDIDKPCQYFFGFNPFPAWFQRVHAGVQWQGPSLMPAEMIAAAGLAVLALATLRRVRQLPSA